MSRASSFDETRRLASRREDESGQNQANHLDASTRNNRLFDEDGPILHRHDPLSMKPVPWRYIRRVMTCQPKKRPYSSLENNAGQTDRRKNTISYGSRIRKERAKHNLICPLLIRFCSVGSFNSFSLKKAKSNIFFVLAQ